MHADCKLQLEVVLKVCVCICKRFHGKIFIFPEGKIEVAYSFCLNVAAPEIINYSQHGTFIIITKFLENAP